MFIFIINFLNDLHFFVEWMWLRGSNMGNQPSSLERKDSAGHSDPGSRAGAASWKDHHGNMWMFGGQGYDHHDTEMAHVLNDLWMFNSTAQLWKLVHAGGNGSQPHSGMRQVPSPRWGAAACGVGGIVMIVFGGEDANGDELYDTWIFEIKTRKWLPLYIRKKDGKRPEHPEGRVDMTSWCQGDKLIVFGGLGNHRTPLDDMWLFSLRTLQWNKVTQIINTKEVINSPSPVLFPEHRTGASSWAGRNRQWFMFGGNKAPNQFKGFESHRDSELIGDMWSFEISVGNASKRNTATWTHIYSDDHKGQPGPVARQHATSWMDYNGFLWVFGGQNMVDRTTHFLSDSWKFHPKQKSWSHESSHSGNSTYVSMKSKAHLLPNISPNSRCHAVGWTHKNITYVFGGYGLDARGKISYLNDLWVFVQPYTNVPNGVFSVDYTEGRKWFHNLPPYTVFWTCLGTFGGLALVFGAGFFVKKMLIDYPRHNPNSGFNVRYVPLKDEANFEIW